MLRHFQIVLFVALLCIVLFAANLVVYEALTLVVGSGAAALALGVLLGVGSASFVIATLLGMRYYNAFTRVYYLLSAVWVGAFVYFFLASVVCGVVAMIPGSPARPVAEVCMLVALVVSVWGIVHARRIRVARVEVTLPGLPAAWAKRTALFMSDLHLGQIHGASFARRVTDAVRSLAPAIVFIGGDLFDGTGAPDIAELVAPLRDIVAPLGIYYVTGNHEEFGNNSKFLAAVRALGIRTLMDEKVDVEGLQLLGVDYHTASNERRFAGILDRLGIDPTKPSILLKHEPNHLAVAQEAGVSLQLSGHTHRGQQWPFKYVAQISYGAFVWGLNRFKNMQVYTSSGVGTWGPPVRVGTDSELVLLTFV